MLCLSPCAALFPAAPAAWTQSPKAGGGPAPFLFCSAAFGNGQFTGSIFHHNRFHSNRLQNRGDRSGRFSFQKRERHPCSSQKYLCPKIAIESTALLSPEKYPFLHFKKFLPDLFAAFTVIYLPHEWNVRPAPTQSHLPYHHAALRRCPALIIVGTRYFHNIPGHSRRFLGPPDIFCAPCLFFPSPRAAGLIYGRNRPI